jgi:hypothetical protein
MNITDLKKMSIGERLQAMEALWDSFLYEDVEIESPKWHEKILEERKKILKMAKRNLSPLRTLRRVADNESEGRLCIKRGC